VKTRLRQFIFILISTAALSSHYCVADQGIANQPDTPGQYHVQSLDPNLDASSMGGPNVVVHPAPTPKQNPDALLPSTETRDKAFKQVGIADELAGWDQLDRDQLYLRAQHMKQDRVLGYYPKLTRKKLIALVEMLHQQMRQEAASK
jgi:hypothetical protein